ncbi:MAG TPA: hypothetical protein VNX68_11280, partial [Nitrosopumilaceae archaeon]|nr:hypothetical protein [Nitrosopumilaceae archaeon]
SGYEKLECGHKGRPISVLSATFRILFGYSNEGWHFNARRCMECKILHKHKGRYIFHREVLIEKFEGIKNWS